jgi:hypothetical protein
MKSAIEELVNESLRREIPLPVTRSVNVKRLPGKVSVLIGMRRTGKTWLCFQRMRELLRQGVARERLLYLNFEDDRLAGLSVSDLKWIPEVFYALNPAYRKQTCYLFFDEIQLVNGWEQFVRRLLDTEKVEITVTGSSAKLLSSEIGSSLRGRGLATEVFPLDFKEFCTFNGIHVPGAGAVGSQMRAEMQHAAGRYFETGGFPEVQGVEASLRRDVLQEYVGAVILRDVVDRHAVTNVVALRALVRQILQNPGAALSLTRFTGMLKALGIPVAKNSLLAYLEHLQDAYLCFPVEIHDRSVRRRQVNDRKLYAIDVGLQRAFALGQTADQGRFLESLVFMKLRRQGYRPDYYRTKAGHEVDFIVGPSDDKTLIRCCWSLDKAETRERELRALREAAAEMPGSQCMIVTWLEDDETAGVRVLPYWKWALEKTAGQNV